MNINPEGMSPEEKAVYYRDKIRVTLSPDQKKGHRSDELHYDLLEIKRYSLHTIPLEDGIAHNNLPDWIYHHIGSYKAEDTLGYAVRVVEQILMYAMQYTPLDENTKIITPERLIQEGGINKLKSVLQYFDEKSESPERNNILNDIVTVSGTKHFRKKYTTPTTSTIPYTLARASDGNSNIIIMRVSNKQLSKLQTALQDIAEPHETSSYEEIEHCLKRLL